MTFLRSFIVTFLLISCAVSSSLAWNMSPPQKTSTTTRHHQQQQQQQQQKVKDTVVSFICACTLFTAALPFSAGAVDIQKGQQIFDNNCAACHIGGQNLVNPPRTLQKEAIVKNLGSLEPSTIQDFVQNSRVHRGAFILGSKLSNRDFENVVNYVVDQAANDKWTTTPATE